VAPTTEAPATTVDTGSGPESGSTTTVVTTTTEDVGRVTEPLTDNGGDGGDGGLPVDGPTLILAGLAALAAAVYFGWLASLGRFLAGSALGLFLLAFWRRRKVPTPPRQLRVREVGDDIQFTWTEPRRPRKLDRYSIEGFEDERWLLVHEHMGTTTHAKHPQSAQPAVTLWRVIATNRHGTSRSSGEVETQPETAPETEPEPPRVPDQQVDPPQPSPDATSFYGEGEGALDSDDEVQLNDGEAPGQDLRREEGES